MINHMLNHKASLNKNKKVKIIKKVLLKPQGMKLETKINMQKQMSFHIHQMVIILKKKKQKIVSVSRNVEKLEPSWNTGGNVKWCSLAVSQKVDVELPYESTIPLLGICSRELNPGVSSRHVKLSVHCSTVHNSQGYQQPIYMSINR